MKGRWGWFSSSRTSTLRRYRPRPRLQFCIRLLIGHRRLAPPRGAGGSGSAGRTPPRCSGGSWCRRAGGGQRWPESGRGRPPRHPLAPSAPDLPAGLGPSLPPSRPPSPPLHPLCSRRPVPRALQDPSRARPRQRASPLWAPGRRPMARGRGAGGGTAARVRDAGGSARLRRIVPGPAPRP